MFASPRDFILHKCMGHYGALNYQKNEVKVPKTPFLSQGQVLNYDFKNYFATKKGQYQSPRIKFDKVWSCEKSGLFVNSNFWGAEQPKQAILRIVGELRNTAVSGLACRTYFCFDFSSLCFKVNLFAILSLNRLLKRSQDVRTKLVSLLLRHRRCRGVIKRCLAVWNSPRQD